VSLGHHSRRQFLAKAVMAASRVSPTRTQPTTQHNKNTNKKTSLARGWSDPHSAHFWDRPSCGSDRPLRRAAYSFSYPHLFISPTVQQPVSMQVSYRLWQTRCVPQCKRACEQVARCWADASLEDIAINGTPTVATRTALKIKRVMTACEPTAAHAVLSRSPSIATQACELWDC
jgi:hypothetical protein